MPSKVRKTSPKKRQKSLMNLGMINFWVCKNSWEEQYNKRIQNKWN